MLRSLINWLLSKNCRICGEPYPRWYGEVCPHCIQRNLSEIEQVLQEAAWNDLYRNDDAWGTFRDPNLVDEPIQMYFGIDADGWPWFRTEDDDDLPWNQVGLG